MPRPFPSPRASALLGKDSIKWGVNGVTTVSGQRQREKLPSGGCPVYVNVYIYPRDVTCRNLLLCSSLIKDECRGNYHKGKGSQGLLLLVLLAFNCLEEWYVGASLLHRHAQTFTNGCARAHTEESRVGKDPRAPPSLRIPCTQSLFVAWGRNTTLSRKYDKSNAVAPLEVKVLATL